MRFEKIFTFFRPLFSFFGAFFENFSNFFSRPCEHTFFLLKNRKNRPLFEDGLPLAFCDYFLSKLSQQVQLSASQLQVLPT